MTVSSAIKKKIQINILHFSQNYLLHNLIAKKLDFFFLFLMIFCLLRVHARPSSFFFSHSWAPLLSQSIYIQISGCWEELSFSTSDAAATPARYLHPPGGPKPEAQGLITILELHVHVLFRLVLKLRTYCHYTFTLFIIRPTLSSSLRSVRCCSISVRALLSDLPFAVHLTLSLTFALTSALAPDRGL